MPQCHSTNEIAAQILDHSSTLEGTVVITDRQTKGKGQRGNTWISADFMNLTFSIVLKPTFLLPGNQFHLNIVAALGVHQAVRRLLNVPVFVKWPNDIMVEERKLAGILIENRLQGKTITHSIVGIGLNVNQRTFAIPTATSMVLASGGESFHLSRVLETVLECIEEAYRRLQEGAVAPLKSSYEACLYRKDEVHTFAAGEDTFQGCIRGIDDQGRLHIDADGDGPRFFRLKQVRYIR